MALMRPKNAMRHQIYFLFMDRLSKWEKWRIDRLALH